MNNKLLTKAYYNGIREGIEQYAHWKDGVQYVGTCGTELKVALSRIDAEEKRALEWLEDRRETKSNLGYSRIGLGNV
jgi:hypothetical protein